MAVVETTTIRVRRSTQRRLAEEAKLAGTSVVEVLEAAVDLLEEQRLLASMDESYRKFGDEIHEEMRAWLEMPLDGPADER
jgi:uncharacterized protein (DUF1778 family)